LFPLLQLNGLTTSIFYVSAWDFMLLSRFVSLQNFKIYCLWTKWYLVLVWDGF